MDEGPRPSHRAAAPGPTPERPPGRLPPVCPRSPPKRRRPSDVPAILHRRPSGAPAAPERCRSGVARSERSLSDGARRAAAGSARRSVAASARSGPGPDFDASRPGPRRSRRVGFEVTVGFDDRRSSAELAPQTYRMQQSVSSRPLVYLGGAVVRGQAADVPRRQAEPGVGRHLGQVLRPVRQGPEGDWPAPLGLQRAERAAGDPSGRSRSSRGRWAGAVAWHVSGFRVSRRRPCRDRPST